MGDNLAMPQNRLVLDGILFLSMSCNTPLVQRQFICISSIQWQSSTMMILFEIQFILYHDAVDMDIVRSW